ncbi:MAG TPA: phospholipase D-like domain-containing protein [Bryobacteraceae bacterium]|nr:phospholipase D-like domain-containing protein [Bryobacteraceae bacterium]
MPLIKGINRAKKSVEIIIFRFNRSEIEKALSAAVTRGVHVHALIAYTNRGGEQRLRDLEMRLLAAGVTVSRTDDDLVRYHSKLMIIDRRVLFVLAFNFTYLDMERSRSFGVITTNRKHVEEAAKLFEADTKRHPYTAGSATFIVSPTNARKRITEFLKGAKKELLIYDPEISDPAIIRTLEARARAGVTISIIGQLKVRNSVLPEPRTLPIRLHTRSIIRDESWAFVGSQSLRALELDARREVGIIFHDPKVIARLTKTFREDWESKGQSQPIRVSADEARAEDQVSASRLAKKVAKAVADDLDPVKPAVETAMEELSAADNSLKLNHAEMDVSVKQAVKNAVKQVVLEFVEQASESQGAGAKS